MVQGEGGLWCLSDDAHNAPQVGLNYQRLRDWAKGLGVEESVRRLKKEDGKLKAVHCKGIWDEEFFKW